MSVTDDRYTAALRDLSAVDPYHGDATDEYIARICGNLGVTDLTVIACERGRTAGERPGSVAGLAEPVDLPIARRQFLASVVPFVHPETIARTGPWDIPDDDEPEPDFPGLRVTAGLLWWLAFAAAGFSGDKTHPDAPAWYALDPQNGWLGYVAGLTRSEYADQEPRPTSAQLRTLLALGDGTSGDHERRKAARRVMAAIAVYAQAGDPAAPVAEQPLP